MPRLAGKEVGVNDVHAIGYGLMGLTWRENPSTYEQAFTAMRAALNSGANFWNGGQIYGPPNANSLQLLNAYFTRYPADADKVVISIKGGLNIEKGRLDGSAENMKKCVDNCLEVLNGTKFLDMFECGRVDPTIPIEESIEALAEYVKAGKLGGISLSECSAESIRRAAAVHKIECVEVEFSLFATDILHNGVARVCAELGIPIIAYSPLSRGFLTEQFKSVEDVPKRLRDLFPRFQGENFVKNMKLVEEVRKIADRKGCTIGQIAIAWVMAQSGRNGLPVMIPIPGSVTEQRVLENNHLVTLTEAELEELDEFVKNAEVVGDRYGGHWNTLVFGDSPAR